MPPKWSDSVVMDRYQTPLDVAGPIDATAYFARCRLAPGLPEATRLALGTAGLGGVWGDKANEASIEVLHDAWRRGHLLTDTSPNYRDAEQVLGDALKRWDNAEHRPIVTTKTEGYEKYRPGEGESWREAVTRQFDESRKAFGREIDGLAMHDAETAPPEFQDECHAFQKELLERNAVKLLGLGGGGPNIQRRWLAQGDYRYIITYKRLCAVSLQALHDVVPAARDAGAKVLVGSAMFMGLLGSKFDAYRVTPPKHIDPVFIERADALHAFAKKRGMPMTQLALRFVLSMPACDFLLAGCGRPETWRDTLAAYEAGPLDAETYAEMWRIAQQGEEVPTGG